MKEKEIKKIQNLKDLNDVVKNNTSVINAIQLKCYDCCCFDYEEVKQCCVTTCALYPFRLGNNPFLKREYTEEQKEQMRERMLNARKHRSSINN